MLLNSQYICFLSNPLLDIDIHNQVSRSRSQGKHTTSVEGEMRVSIYLPPLCLGSEKGKWCHQPWSVLQSLACFLYFPYEGLLRIAFIIKSPRKWQKKKWKQNRSTLSIKRTQRNEHAIAKQRCQRNNERWTVPPASYPFLKFNLAKNQLSMDHCLLTIAQTCVSAANPSSSYCSMCAKRCCCEEAVTHPGSVSWEAWEPRHLLMGDKWALWVQISTFFKESKFYLSCWKW